MFNIAIACYIETRMISFLTREGDRAETPVVKAVAVITMIVAGILIFQTLQGMITD
ncbi:MAG: hypothetical protein GY842_12130 [bacterium]|nr:hypothetical protein [bacterium]